MRRIKVRGGGVVGVRQDQAPVITMGDEKESKQEEPEEKRRREDAQPAGPSQRDMPKAEEVIHK